MKEIDFNETKESKEENIDIKELLFKYLIHWPWFVGAVVVCLIAAWVYPVSYTHLDVYKRQGVLIWLSIIEDCINSLQTEIILLRQVV